MPRRKNSRTKVRPVKAPEFKGTIVYVSVVVYHKALYDKLVADLLCSMNVDDLRALRERIHAQKAGLPQDSRRYSPKG